MRVRGPEASRLSRAMMRRLRTTVASGMSFGRPDPCAQQP